MAKEKVSRKELLKEPDEFLTVSARAIEYAQNNPRRIITAVAIIILAVVAVIAYLSYRQNRLEASQALYSQALYAYVEAVGGKEEPSDKRLEDIYAMFDRIAREYGSYPTGEMALLYTGHILFKQGRYEEALKRYTEMKSTGLVQEGLESLVMYHLAATRLAMKDYDAARDLFSELAKDPNSPYAREAYSSIAGIYEVQGKTKEAIQAYRQYLKMFPQAPDAPYVRSRIADLSAQG